MTDIDIARCIRGAFVDVDKMTTGQRALAAALIVKGPPEWRCVVLQLPDGAAYDVDSDTIKQRDVSVRLRHPLEAERGYEARIRKPNGTGTLYRKVR